jgi:hypothetical protein
MKKFSGDMGPVLFEPWATLHRRCDGWPRLQKAVMWLGRRLQPRQIEMDAGRFAEDPFASVWDAASLERMRALLRRVAAVGEAEAVPLYLFWGTLLGHVREGGILAWDDDADLALFEAERAPAVQAALEAAGLSVVRYADVLKVFDPTTPATAGRDWSFPFVDIFVYQPGTSSKRVLPFETALLLPGRPVAFEGARLWEPEQPLEVLDQYYRGWREKEKSTWWNHREDRMMRIIAVRGIRTDARGRKLS